MVPERLSFSLIAWLLLAAFAAPAAAAESAPRACQVVAGPVPQEMWVVSAAQTSRGDLLLVDSLHDRLWSLPEDSQSLTPMEGPLAEAIHGRWPIAIRWAGDQLLLELFNERAILAVDRNLNLRPGTASRVIGARSAANGRSLDGDWLWEPVHGGQQIVSCADYTVPTGRPPEQFGLVQFEFDDPASFSILLTRPLDHPLRFACRLLLPVLATVDARTVYALVPGDTPQIYQLAPDSPARPLGVFPERFAHWPDLPIDARREEFPMVMRQIERATMPAGLFGWAGSLYLLSRTPTDDGTEWWLTKIDPETPQLLGTMRLNSRADHLMVVPDAGGGAWKLVEKASPRSFGYQKVERIITVPSEQIRRWQPDGELCPALRTDR